MRHISIRLNATKGVHLGAQVKWVHIFPRIHVPCAHAYFPPLCVNKDAEMMNTKIYYAILFNSKHLKYWNCRRVSLRVWPWLLIKNDERFCVKGLNLVKNRSIYRAISILYANTWLFLVLSRLIPVSMDRKVDPRRPSDPLRSAVPWLNLYMVVSWGYWGKFLVLILVWTHGRNIVHCNDCKVTSMLVTDVGDKMCWWQV